ncbi:MULTISPECIES: type I polyketide synthase [unclassified Nodularia (in: cyanobacteria)]|uniref:beta-ketoacyl synthase N-terminal-like domain-containing protein n=1 Tax=unclassified Nodularia (in: cyanobacteria) TaxID=2656917 RepID=UPI001880146B|nr:MULTISPECIES: type I polyketide synthase [unclassified Nodularia (in: cyanobacteria)]MBE9200002.1 type I polyketide synthase [Nodularia sp. LEGE 06071]MCC2695288.1 type I polyketide synthase [Nodularia sp. LEGE 04288]
MEKFTQNQIPKIAIVGMECYLGGGCEGLDTFEQSIYEGTQHFIPLPDQRWTEIKQPELLLEKYGFQGSQAPLGAYIQDWQISAKAGAKFNPQELLMLQVADNAFKDAGIHPGAKVAVIIVSAAELALSQSTQIEEPYIENNLGNYISQLWEFTGASFTFTPEGSSVFKALELAQKLLKNKEVDAVLVGAVEKSGDSGSVLLRNQITAINTGVNTLSYDENANGWMVGEGAAAIVLKLHETAKQHNRIYAVIDALSLVENPTSQINSIPTAINAETITQACQQAFQLADIKPKDIGYLEVIGSGIPSQDESEIRGLLQAYRTSEADLSCALGSVKANVGHTYAVSGLVSIVKTALCLYRRYIPVVPQWSSPKMPEIWQDSPFYVAGESKPWFSDQRIAAVNGMEVDGSYAHLILSAAVGQQTHGNNYLEQIPYYLFAIAADDQASLLKQIHTLQQTITDCSSLKAAARETFKAFQQHQQPTYTLSILARNQEELNREIQRSLQGVNVAFETGKDWQTPVGSYFTAKPLGKDNDIAFVYSGSFNAYVGIARYLFRFFPQIYDDLLNRGIDHRAASIEKLLYPRSLTKISKRQLETIEEKLMDDAVTLLEFEVYFTGFMTAILRDYFQIQPQSAFGYSLGETSMMFAQGVWNNFKQSSQNLNSSSLFKTRLVGSKNAVREYWRLPQDNHIPDQNLWCNYVLLCPLARVREAIKSENRVYLTLINTSDEVIIGGEPQACGRVIETLKCVAYRTPIKHAIHCEPIHSEYNELAQINTLPVENIKKTVFYSAAEYKPIPLDSNSIGHNIAKTLCQELDFPRLVNRVYNDGSKILLEVGVGGNCSRWISKILQGKEHLTASLNRRGIDDHISIIRVLAKLLSHRVEMDLSPLYSLSPANLSHNQSTMEAITLDSHKTDEKFLKVHHPKIDPEVFSTSSVNLLEQQHELLQFRELAKSTYSPSQNLITTEKKTIMSSLISESLPENLAFDHPNKASSLLVSDRITLPKPELLDDHLMITEKESSKNLLPADEITDSFLGKTQLPNLRRPHYQHLNQNAARMTETHATLLEFRQESLHQISALVQQQLELYQNLFDK